ncbi:hypothetical protein [Chondromyces apiculatus]|uniref:Uncharacterized protein n=1 Tax=Chondromyces apiculatus DSM 436 TaxID=1192034 RepID=A0A017SUQ2_9BACT|nr:hypothetical protein [Chondromyces apiculatus]EYF00006.1 Hypothetical protein CAP_1642 [Chondromyces apiculatus DSM 436]
MRLGQGFRDKLMSTLVAMGHACEEVHLEVTPEGRVAGHIVSDAFRGKTQMHRQHQLWKELRQRLTRAELARIVALLTVTPAEIADD